jgi:hypothetical protein
MAARFGSLAVATLAIGCSATLFTPDAPPPTISIVTPRLTQSRVDKIDLLVVVDNGPSMSDKQQLLALAIPDLIAGLANPRCLDDVTGKPVGGQPAGPLDSCPKFSQREFPPVLDMHVGVLSSSLGSFGAIACPGLPLAGCPSSGATPDDDHGHLLTRADPCGMTTVPTYENLGFLAFDPQQTLNPPGVATVGSLVDTLRKLVVGVGSEGCFIPSQNEAWYRFLVDPNPYQGIQLVNNQVQVSGIDQVLLKQRQAFLRPDSLLAIVNLSDTDDASLKEYSSYPLFADFTLHLPHPTQDCFTKGPTDKCCASCGQPTPSGCVPDPMCMSSPSYTSQDENIALRRFGLIDDKQRYGIEFFYPPSRYVGALKDQTVKDVNGKDVPNPIYTNLDPTRYSGAVRDSGLVFYTAIVGVPWQLIARQNAAGQPDLLYGVSAMDKSQVGGFKTATELSLPDAHGNAFWDDIAGDPENYVPARSPFMDESTAPRTGEDPITNIAMSPASTPNGSGNPLNDHEWTIPTPPGDIEYACTFPLVAPIDESGAAGSMGDCASNPTHNPLCSPNPNDSGKNTLQTKAKAYPGVKHLAIARGMNSQGIAASICPKQLTDPTSSDFGYRPAMNAIVGRLKQALHGECLPRTLTVDAQGQVACVILEGLHVDVGTCTCDASKGRSSVTAEHQPLVVAAQADPASKSLDCFCEIDQTSGAALNDCRTSPHPSANGWCYVDATEGEAEAAILKDCPLTEKQELRFVGEGMPAPDATIFVNCGGG